MAIIKSALEIALEKTRNVEADKEALEANTYITEGKKAVSKFLYDESCNLNEYLEKYKNKRLSWFKEGMLQALLGNLKLPADEIALKQSKRAGEGLFPIIRDNKRLNKLLSQMEHFLGEYLEERKRVVAAVEQQYAPRLRQKEEELSRHTGAQVRIDPSQDPDFLKLLRQNLALLEDRYNKVLDQVKQEIKRMAKEA